MATKENIFPLLESIVTDNRTYKFPIEFISKELLNLYTNQAEFDYFMMQAYKKLNVFFGHVISHVFLNTIELKLNLKEINIYELPVDEYEQLIGNFMTSLENIHITRIEKNSPDGEMMSAMI